MAGTGYPRWLLQPEKRNIYSRRYEETLQWKPILRT